MNRFRVAQTREQVGRWLEGHAVISTILGVLYYLWAIALFMGVLKLLQWLFPWTFLGQLGRCAVDSLTPAMKDT